MGGNQLFENFGYKGVPQSKFYPFQGNTFLDQENANTFNLNKEENNFKSAAGLANFPQKPDMNKLGQNYFYPNFKSNAPQIIQVNNKIYL